MEGFQNKAKSSYIGTLSLSAVMTAVAHPLTYVKVLIQVGHEPLPPQQITTFFGKKVLRLPNFFQYAQHIKDKDGWLGLYRGLGPRLLHNVISSTITNSITNKVQEQKEREKVLGREIDGDSKSVKVFLHETGNLVIAKTAGIVVSYPLHVISIRMMVQFVGRETYYRNIFSSIKEIYQEEGFFGFFSGLIPHIVGELFALWMCRTISYIAQTYLMNETYAKKYEIQNYTQATAQYIASMVTYPFHLVTSLMIVNDTRLVAGNPPLMPIYESWTECWVQLGKKGLRNRGSTLFRRAVVGHF